MSRHGYSDGCDDNWALIRWRGAVNSAIRGKRGQQALKEIAAALDALPEKELASESLVTPDGEFCTLGALGRVRGMDMGQIDPDDREAVAKAFGISEAMAAEIMYLNDEYFTDDWKWVEVEICGPMRPGYPDHGRHIKSVRVPNKRAARERWSYMREWVQSNIIGADSATERKS
jgi:hypothetical protein